MVELFYLPSLEPVSALIRHSLLILCAYFFARKIVVWIRNHLSSDLHAIPGPSILEWTRAKIGHALVYPLLCLDPFDLSTIFNRWRKDYGSVYQLRSILGERVIMVSSESGIRTVTVSKSQNFVKNPMTKKFLAPLVGENGILLAEGNAHARLRKAVAPAMHHESLVLLGSVFLREGKALADRLAHLGDNCEGLLLQVRAATFDVIFQTCFSQEVSQSDRVDKLQKAYHEAFEEPMWRTFLTCLLQTIFWFVDPKVFNWREDLNRYIVQTTYELCGEHLQNRSNTSSVPASPLLSLMVDEDTQKNITSREMVETVLSFLTAGQLSTSLSVCWTLYLLAREPEWQERLVDELKSWSEEDGLSALDSLPLLNRIVKESIRVYPPVCYITRVCTKATEIDGFRVPEGTAVRMPIAAIHRNEDIWGPDANKFNPDRFLCDETVAKTRMFWCAFLFGSRSCLGQRFALLEVKAFVAQVLAKQTVYMKELENPTPTCIGSLAVPNNMNLYFRTR